eukprot:TRINITY_DN26656_c0_g3_i1.p1 TRINITY_DN26656_c0_g3~~TRINITY_DN26656_c0_g3_i1.p1  ORF type:complete len:483 (+),score=74.84 TRINITY_DN26656_c0_g3_i1:63-1451(+)
MVSRRPSLSLQIPVRDETPTAACAAAQARFASMYTMLDAIGHGTFGCVMRAQRLLDGKFVAIKHISTEDPEQQATARREFELLRGVNNAAVAAVIDFFELSENIYMVMELCNLGDVNQHVEAYGSFSEDGALSLFADVLYGLSYLHCRRIIHCDVKPSNLLLERKNGCLAAKICDFNSARRVGCNTASALLTHRGTPAFNAPELQFGDHWNERVDIWSCGMSFYFMLRAALPFSEAPRKAARFLMKKKLPPLDWGDLCRSMRHLVEQCLTVNFYDRPPAVELLQHPIFYTDLHSDCGSDFCSSSDESEDMSLSAAQQNESHVFAWMSSCGFLFLAPLQYHDLQHGVIDELEILSSRTTLASSEHKPKVAESRRSSSKENANPGCSNEALGKSARIPSKKSGRSESKRSVADDFSRLPSKSRAQNCACDGSESFHHQLASSKFERAVPHEDDADDAFERGWSV